MKQIGITVSDKVARLVDENTIIICDNSDYVANFNFDSEWDAYDVKTARFIWNGKYEEKVFTGTQCDIPVINDTSCVYIGVYAGNLSTTTGARVPTRTSILCGSPVHNEPEPDVYNQIMELIQGLGKPDPETIAAAVAEYIAANPITETDPTVSEWAKTKEKPTYTAEEVGAIADTELQTAIDTALAQAKASGEFDGADGQPGADGNDYVLTDTDKQEIAEQAAGLVEIPSSLPNPNALTFTGAVSATYDGSAAVSVEIPSGGGSADWELIGEVTSDGAGGATGITVPFDGSQYKQIFVFAYDLPANTLLRAVIRTSLAWYNASHFGYSGYGTSSTPGGLMNNTWSMTGLAYAVGDYCFLYGAAEAANNGGNAPWRQGHQLGTAPKNSLSAYKYVSLDTNSSDGVVPEGCTLKVWGLK